MELTKNTIVDIIHWGEPEHSPIAAEFIKEAKRLYNIDVIACYSDAWQHLYFGDELEPTGKTDPKDARLVNIFSLTLYLRGNGRKVKFYLEEKYGNDLLDLMMNIIASSGTKIEYTRTFSSAENRYYGWEDKRWEECDRSKILYPDKPIEEKKEISVESFDNLAMWHYMCDGLRKINSFESRRELGARVYCGWDEKEYKPNLYIILPEGFSSNSDMHKRELLNADILSYLHSKDKCGGVVRDEDFKPIYTFWSLLSEHMKFALSRN